MRATMPWRDRLVGQFAGRPVADRAPRVGRWGAGQGHDPAELLRRERRRRAGAGRIREHAPHHRLERPLVPSAALKLRCQQRVAGHRPAASPRLDQVAAHAQVRRYLAVAPPLGCCQHDPRPHHQRLWTRAGSHHLLKHSTLPGGHPNPLRAGYGHAQPLLVPVPYHPAGCSTTSADAY